MSFGNDADISMSDRHISLPLCHIGQTHFTPFMLSWPNDMQELAHIISRRVDYALSLPNFVFIDVMLGA